MFYGPAYWRFMHHFALHDQGRDLMVDLGQFIGCAECAAEYEAPTDNQDLVLWSKNLHNKVNAKLGKWDKWDMTDFHIGHKPDCDICADKVHFGYPWLFIHQVAETGNAAAIPFLQKFDQTYPCDKCRGTFLPDAPNDDESAIDWTIRNHKLVQPTFEYFPKPPQDLVVDATGNVVPSSQCAGCPPATVTGVSVASATLPEGVVPPVTEEVPPPPASTVPPGVAPPPVEPVEVATTAEVAPPPVEPLETPAPSEPQ